MTAFWVIAGVSLLLAVLILARISRGIEVGCALVTLPIMWFAFFTVMALVLQVTTGWNYVTLIVTEGRCAYRECMFK